VYVPLRATGWTRKRHGLPTKQDRIRNNRFAIIIILLLVLYFSMLETQIVTKMNKVLSIDFDSFVPCSEKYSVFWNSVTNVID
jgi:hypothetical protein